LCDNSDWDTNGDSFSLFLRRPCFDILLFIKFQHYLLERQPHQLQCLQSTPLLKATQKNRETSCFTDISPIIRDAESNRQLAGMRELQLLMWQMKNDRQANRSDADGMATTAVSDRQTSRSDTDGIQTRAVNDRETNSSDTDRMRTTDVNDMSLVLPSLSDVSVRDLSTWVGGRTFDRVDDRDPSRFSIWVQEFGHCDPQKRLKEVHGDLDVILQKLQEMLASNFSSEGTEYNNHSTHETARTANLTDKKL